MNIYRSQLFVEIHFPEGDEGCDGGERSSSVSLKR